MLRLTQIKLPLDYNDAALKAAVIERLDIAPNELLDITVFRRGYDARKRSNIFFIFTLDVRAAGRSTIRCFGGMLAP